MAIKVLVVYRNVVESDSVFVSVAYKALDFAIIWASNMDIYASCVCAHMVCAVNVSVVVDYIMRTKQSIRKSGTRLARRVAHRVECGHKHI